MQRKDLEHLIRAAAAITNQYEIVVIGSQSILGSEPTAPDVLLQSMEADFYPLHEPELADLIDGAIGELSPFHDRFGYYAQGVGPNTAILPDGWQGRLVKIQNENIDLKIGLCLDPTDLAASKLAAGRDKDWLFVSALLTHALIERNVLIQRINNLPIKPEKKQTLTTWVNSKNLDKDR
jgi:hypothetical protein